VELNHSGEVDLSKWPVQPNPPLCLLYPLDEFYQRAGLPLPPVVHVEGYNVPEPYRSLLVHERDMTPTLTQAYQRKMQLRILKRILSDEVLAREIVLDVEGDSRVAVYAGIKIYLEHFPPEARRLILEGGQPFGAILGGQGIVHYSRPEAFFRIDSDDVINHALGLTGHSVLYGRRSALWNSPQIPLAHVLEILPPCN
jgi:chorismate-pyruvate lyase